MRIHNSQCARSEYRTQLAKMSFDEIFDLTAGVYFNFYNNIYIHLYFLAHFYFPASGQARGHRRRSFSPRLLPSIFIAHRVQQSHCSSIFHRVFLTHVLAFSASQFVHKTKNYTNTHSGGFEHTKLTYNRLEDIT